MIALVKLILAHIIGDFFLQRKEWVKHKEEKKWTSWFLYVHVLMHFLLVLILFWDLSVWPAALCIAASHFLIDGVKMSFLNKSNQSKLFLADQAAHIVVLLAVWAYFWQGAILFSPDESFWVVAAGVLFLTNPVSFLMMNLMSRWNEEIKEFDDSSLAGAGKHIGILERVFIFIAILTGYLQVIGFLLAAKSIFRFGDLTRSKDRKLTEYILIGTLLSFLIAIATGFLVKSLV